MSSQHHTPESHVPAELAHSVERFDHLALAVRDISAALPMVTALGGAYRNGGHHPTAGFRWVQFVVAGGMKLELLSPLETTDEDHFLVRFLADRGEGPHHVTFKVADIGSAVSAWRAAGFEVVGVNRSDAAWQEAFVHPKTANGLLIQLAQWDDSAQIDLQPLEWVLAAP
jgi:methylmalonyl-CoA/ethylmalonyl-CoA epimerase